MLSLFINWDISPEIFNLGGISIRYYGLLFAVAFILGYKVEEKMFKSEGLPMAWLDKLWLYVAIATIVGARLGHCIFYDWAYYSQHPLEMILPVRFSPEFKFTGYQGLAAADCCRNRKWQKRGMSYVVWIFGGCVDPANAGLHDDEAE